MSQSLQKGVEALLFLASKRSAGVTEIAEALSVNKSTAFRIMETFLATDMVDKNADTSKYKLGAAILKLSQQYYKGLSVASVAKPYMIRLSEAIGESVHLCVFSNNHAIVVEQIISDGRLVVNAEIGSRESIQCSSVGKCLLAFAEEARQERMISGIVYEEFTSSSIQNNEDLFIELSKIKEQGYALDNCELSNDIKCVAAPIFNNRGECNYSIGVSGAANRMTEDKTKYILERLIKVADAISSELGYSKPK